MHCSGHFKPILVYKGGAYKKGFLQSGNDRDAYIANNNGGFTIAHAPTMQIKPSTTYVAQPPRAFDSMGIDKTVRNNVRAHVPIYRQNGTGRDTYILNNNGGFAIAEGENKFCGYQQDFKRSLRNYPPSQPMNKSTSSVSPVRYRSVAGSLATTLNRFKIYQKRTSADKTVEENQEINSSMPASIQAGPSRPKVGHYRTQSHQITQETTERIRMYLKQRQAYSKAQELHNSLSQKIDGPRNGSLSCGRLGAEDGTVNHSSSNPKTRNITNIMGNLEGGKFKTQDADAQASLVLAVKSTPSLNQAFSKRNSNKAQFFTKQDLATGASEMDTSGINLNVLSHDDLSITKEVPKSREKSRPMTTKFGDRRFTQQPSTSENPIFQDGNSEVNGIYQRHSSPQKTALQVFKEYQQVTCARMAVPHERRRRDRFDGTQNSFLFQTVGPSAVSTLEAANININQNFGVHMRNTVFQTRQNTEGSLNGLSPMARVNSSLMGTTARQKLLQYKLKARQNESTLDAGKKAQIKSQIEELNDIQSPKVQTTNEVDHMVMKIDVPKQQSQQSKKSKKERLLAAIYKSQNITEAGANLGSARQTLKANLRQNLKLKLKAHNTQDHFHQRTQSVAVPNIAQDFSKSIVHVD